MVERLLLGGGSLVQPLAGSLRERPGTTRVGTADETLAMALREEGTEVTVLDPTDGRALADQPADVVFVLEDSREAALATARAARAAFPEAFLLAYAGEDARDHGSPLTGVVDSVLDPGRAVAGEILGHIGDAGLRVRELWDVLDGIERLLVLAHDNPDPDAIASGVALAELARVAGCAVDVCYYGEISHQENRAFVNVLGLDLVNLDPDDDLSAYDGIALVDHSRPGVNDQLPADVSVDVIVDHHPPRGPVTADFVDLRSDVGATSSLLVEYFERLDVPLPTDVATALLFGIHVDTNSFSREVVRADFEAAATLLETADLAVLERIEAPSVSAQTLETIASAIRNRVVEGGILLSNVGELGERDALAQAADQLMELEGVHTTVVYGIEAGIVYVSARSRGAELDIGETLRDAFDQMGEAGGHVDMAGGQLDLGALELVDDSDESLHELVEGVVTGRFFDALGPHTDPRTPTIGESRRDPTDAYFVTPPEPSATDETPGTEEPEE